MEFPDLGAHCSWPACQRLGEGRRGHRGGRGATGTAGPPSRPGEAAARPQARA